MKYKKTIIYVVALIFLAVTAMFFVSCDEVKPPADDKIKSLSQNDKSFKKKDGIPILNAHTPYSSTYLHENVALYDRFIRSLDSNEYVIELEFMDFDGSATLPSVLSFEGLEYFDDGTGNDLTSGDGVYTSEVPHSHNISYPYDANNLHYSISDEFMANPAFLYKYELENDTDRGSIVKIKLECDFGTCECSVSWCTCLACVWWDAPGCITYTNCRGGIEIGY